MLQAILLGIIAFIGNCDYALGTSLIKNPIVLGPVVGLVMGDVTQGIIIGGILELAFIGAQSVGGVCATKRCCWGCTGNGVRNIYRKRCRGGSNTSLSDCFIRKYF